MTPRREGRQLTRIPQCPSYFLPPNTGAPAQGERAQKALVWPLDRDTSSPSYHIRPHRQIDTASGNRPVPLISTTTDRHLSIFLCTIRPSYDLDDYSR